MTDDVLEYVIKASIILSVLVLVFFGSMAVWNGLHGDTIKIGVTCHNVIIGKEILVQCVPSPT